MIEKFHTENIVNEDQLLEYFKTEETNKEDITLDEISKLLGTIVNILNTTKKVEINLEIKQIKNDIKKEDIVPDHNLEDEHVFYVLVKK
jgi:hypothetical protein